MINLRLGAARIVLSLAFPGCAVTLTTFCQMTLAIAQEQVPTFGTPVACELGRQCFVQQYVDMDPASGTLDPFCENSTYDGHSGTDVRVLSMTDMAEGVSVLAVADGTVLRTRDGDPDRLVLDAVDREAVSGRECGNGVIMEHAGGIETQYCHLRSGSVRVAPGDSVTKGQPIGAIGASGLAEFPHVHLGVRRAGETIDPVTGLAQGASCDASANLDHSLFDPAVARLMAVVGPQRLASGLADGPVTEAMLVAGGPPAAPRRDASAIVGWSWLVNLRKGDRLTVRLLAADATVFAENEIPPLDRDKATYVAYAGRKRSPVPGDYTVETVVLRGDAIVLSAGTTLQVD